MRTNNHSNNAIMRLPLKVGSGCFCCCAFRYSVYPNSDIRNVQIGLLTECNTQAITESANMLLLVIFFLFAFFVDRHGHISKDHWCKHFEALGSKQTPSTGRFLFFFWLNLSSLVAYQTGAYPGFLLREAISSKKKLILFHGRFLFPRPTPSVKNYWI